MESAQLQKNGIVYNTAGDIVVSALMPNAGSATAPLQFIKFV